MNGNGDLDIRYATPPPMSRRQWLAGMAMHGMLAHATRYKPREGRSQNWHEALSEEAHEIADAMINFEEKELH